MNQTERIADGRRRFFAASGQVQDVLLRDRKSHHDRGLEPGRDYEIETGGVTLTKVPPQGATVIILTGDRTRSDTPEQTAGQDRTRSDKVAAEPALLVPVVKPPQRDIPAPISPMISTNVTPERDASRDMASNANNANNSISGITGNSGDQPTGPDLDRWKRALLFAVRDTNDTTPRTLVWQDNLAKLTAVMLAAPDWDTTRAAFVNIENYLRG